MKPGRPVLVFKRVNLFFACFSSRINYVCFDSNLYPLHISKGTRGGKTRQRESLCYFHNGNSVVDNGLYSQYPHHQQIRGRLQRDHEIARLLNYLVEQSQKLVDTYKDPKGEITKEI